MCTHPAQQPRIPASAHVSTLSDDYYYFDEASHTLEGRRTQKRYRLGDKVRVKVVRVDVNRRQLDFRVAGLADDGEAPRGRVRRMPRGRRRRSEE